MTLEEFKEHLRLDEDSHHDIKYFDQNVALYYLLKTYFNDGMLIDLFESNNKNISCVYRVHPVDEKYDLSYMVKSFKDLSIALYARSYKVNAYMDLKDIVIELINA